jgi:predicted DNA-binding transcriptional regulator YafY
MPINKSAFRRYKVIDQLLRNRMRMYPTMEDIIEACREKLDVDPSPETIQKDIAQMRMSPPDGFEAPIHFNRSKGGYEYLDANYSMSGIALNDTDIDAIKESIDLIKSIGGSRMGEKFNTAMEKILSTVLEEFPDGKQKVSFLETMTPPKSRGFEHFDLFYSACREKIPVSFVHYSYKKRTFNAITIHPFLIKEFENKWYIIGYSERHEEIRTFGLDRVFDPFLLKKAFIEVKKSDLYNSKSAYYGVFPIPDQKQCKIKIRVSALSTQYFEAYPLHESQEIKKNPKGFSMITFDILPTVELARLFLSYGHHVKVMEPKWLITFIENLK